MVVEYLKEIYLLRNTPLKLCIPHSDLHRRFAIEQNFALERRKKFLHYDEINKIEHIYHSAVLPKNLDRAIVFIIFLGKTLLTFCSTSRHFSKNMTDFCKFFQG